MVFKRRRGGKKAYVAKQRTRKREAKKTTEADMAQNYELKKLSKTVKGLTAATKAYSGFATTSGTWEPIPTLVGVSSDASLGGVALFGQDTMTPIAQGTGVGDRLGSSITVRSFSIDYSVRLGLGTTSAQNGLSVAVRVMVICFHSPDGTPGDASASIIPTYHDVFAIQGAGSGMVRTFLRNQYQPLSSNAHVYYDRLHEFPVNSTNASTTALTSIQHGRIKIRPTKRNSMVTFNTTSGAAVDVLMNQWVMIALSDNSTTADVGQPEIIAKGLCVFDA